MHLTLKKEATQPAVQNFLKQQAKFDDFIDCYNRERPHQALDMKYPAEVYRHSPRPYRGLGELDYPFHDRTVTVTHCGRICLGRRKINLSTVFAGQNVGAGAARPATGCPSGPSCPTPNAHRWRDNYLDAHRRYKPLPM